MGDGAVKLGYYSPRRKFLQAAGPAPFSFLKRPDPAAWDRKGRRTMKPGKAFIRAVIALTGAAMAGLWAMKPSTAFEAVPPADVESFRESWRVLDPITARNLAIYPVVSDLKADTSEFLTLDAGVASGEVRIAERGALENGMIRR